MMSVPWRPFPPEFLYLGNRCNIFSRVLVAAIILRPSGGCMGDRQGTKLLKRHSLGILKPCEGMTLLGRFEKEDKPVFSGVS